MDRLFTKLEVTALRTLADGDRGIADWLFPRLSREHFSLDSSQEFFRRIQTLTHKSGRIPNWEELLGDIAISEETRDILEDSPDSVISSRKDAAKVLERLDEFRRARVWMKVAQTITKNLKGGKLDLSSMDEEIPRIMATASSRSDWSATTITFGGKEIDKKGLLRVIRPRTHEFFPTGYVAFDSVNQGIPIGSCMVIAGETSGGKSLLTTDMSVNMAEKGANVSMTSLEMDDQEVAQRVLAKISLVDLNAIQKMQKSDVVLRKKLVKAWQAYHNRVHNNGGRFEIVSPEEDVSIEELLTRMRGRGFDIIVIDYLGLLKGMDEEDQWRKLGAAARHAKIYAKTNRCSVILLAQLSAEGALRYSRTVQEHANLMWQWQRPDESGIATIKQTKARNQKAFDFFLQFDHPHMRVLDVDPAQVAAEVGDAPKGKYPRRAKPRVKSRAVDESDKTEEFSI